MDQCRALFTEIDTPLLIEKHPLSPVEGYFSCVQKHLQNVIITQRPDLFCSVWISFLLSAQT